MYICTTPTVYIRTTPTVYLINSHSIYSLHPQCICSTPTVYMHTAPTVYIQGTHSIYSQHPRYISTTPTVYICQTPTVYIHTTPTVYLISTHSIYSLHPRYISTAPTVYTDDEPADIDETADIDDPSDTDSNNDVPLPRHTVRLTAIIPLRGSSMIPLTRGRRGLVRANDTLHIDIWDKILCAGIPVSLRELVSLSASQLGLPTDMRTLQRLLQCTWTLGWHVTDKDEFGFTRHFWGGGITPQTTSNYMRGDWVEVAGTEVCRGENTSRLARVVCGVEIKNVERIFGKPLIDTLRIWPNKSCKEGDYVVYLLVRYANAHPDTGRARGPDCRPLCPGVLRDTHCLWKWHERPANFSRGCWRARPWSRHRHLFGDTAEKQQIRNAQEARAWYDVIKSSDILKHANVTPDWDRRDAFLQSVMWC